MSAILQMKHCTTLKPKSPLYRLIMYSDDSLLHNFYNTGPISRNRLAEELSSNQITVTYKQDDLIYIYMGTS